MRARTAIAIVTAGALALGLALWSRRLMRPRGGGAPLTVEVRPRRATVLGRDTTRPLDDAALAELRRRPEVLAIVPRLELVGPASASIDVRGEAIRFEAAGFTDGIPAAAVAGDAALAAHFVEPGAPPGPACRPEDGARACSPSLRWYCDGLDLRCHPRVPVLVSPTMVELYDAQFAREHDLPPADVLGLAPGVAADGPTFTIILGESMVQPADGARRARHLVGAVVVGVSPLARTIGMTVPAGDVAAWNRELAGADAAARYSAATVTLRGDRRGFTAAADALGLDVADAP